MSETKKAGREALYEAAAEFVRFQQRQAKYKSLRWGAVIVLLVGYMGFNVWYMLSSDEFRAPTASYAAEVRIDGMISTGKMASTQVLYPVLDQAFSDRSAKCVALVINSPGGMVGQSEMLHDYILKLAKKNNRKVLAVGEDLMASGGFMIASAASKIYAPRMSTVGSIGVRLDGFDLTGIANKLGIKDRTLTAGGMKDSMNPLRPMTTEAESAVRHQLEQIHEGFKQMIKDSRGDRLKAPDNEVFTGAAFTGLDAYSMGLIDGFLPIDEAVKADCGADSVRVYEPHLGLGNLLSFVFNR